MAGSEKRALKNATFKKYITSKFGSITVDTKVEQEEIVQGDIVSGEIELTSKSGLGDVEKIVVGLMQQFLLAENSFHNRALNTQEIRLTPEQQKENQIIIPFSFEVPAHTPVNRKCWIQTDVNVPQKLDPRDMDFVTITEHHHIQLMNRVLTEELGLIKTNRTEVACLMSFAHPFPLKQVKEHPWYRMLSRRKCPAVQEYEYLPSEEFKQKYREVEFFYDIHAQGVDMYFELQFHISKELGGYFKRAAIRESSRDELRFELKFTNEELKDISAIKEKIYNLLKDTQVPEYLQPTN